jgi:hypothetical protein
MKKIVFCIMAMFLSLTILPLQAATSNKVPSNSSTVPKTESAEANRLLLRLNEIKAMDKSKLNASEKKNLRKELRSTKERLKTISGGVYISVGAIILIVILLVILL